MTNNTTPGGGVTPQRKLSQQERCRAAIVIGAIAAKEILAALSKSKTHSDKKKVKAYWESVERKLRP